MKKPARNVVNDPTFKKLTVKGRQMEPLSAIRKKRAIATLDAMLALFRAFGWRQHHMGNPTAGFCLVGAAQYADGPGEKLALRALRVAIGKPPDAGPGVYPLTNYNDSAARTYQDIVQTVVKARTLVATAPLPARRNNGK